MLVSAFITKLRRFSKDLPVSAGETFDGDGTTTTFRLRNSPVLEDQITVKVTGTATTAYTLDNDTGVIIFTTAPPNASDNVKINYQYAKLSDTEWLEIINSVVQELRTKIWTDNTDSSSFTTVAQQSEYDMDDIDSQCFKILGLWYRSSSSIDWTSISADTNVRYFREQNKIVLRPYLQVTGYAMKVRYLSSYPEYTATTDTIAIPERFLKPIMYFCMLQYIDYLMAFQVNSVGANVREATYEPVNNLINMRRTYERQAETLLSRVKPRIPSMAVKTVIAGKID